MKKAISNYLRIIGKLAAYLYKSYPTKFLLLNLLGMFSKLILLVAFVVSIKGIMFVYQGDILTKLSMLLDKSGIALNLEGLLSAVGIVSVLSIFIVTLFVLSGLSGISYTHFMTKYIYECSLTIRRNQSTEFFRNLSSQDLNHETINVKDYVEKEDPGLDRTMRIAITALFEALQGSLILFLCFSLLGVVMLNVMLVILAITFIVTPVFLIKNYYHGSKAQTRAALIKENIKRKKDQIINMDKKSDNDYSSMFFDTIIGSDEERELFYLSKRDERDARVVRLMMNLVLGLFFFGAMWLLFLDRQYLSGDKVGLMVIVLFLIRFIFGILQNTLTALRNLNMEYKNLNRAFKDLDIG